MSTDQAKGDDGPTVGPADRFQRRHPWVGFPLAVVYKFFDDFGPYLAALITYYGFLSIFPLLLLFSTILGFVLDGQPEWQRAILDSAVSEFPIVGDELRETGTLGGGPIGLVVGAAAATYGGLGVGQALQYAMNTAWMVPRNSRPNVILSRARSVMMVLTAGLTVIASTILTFVASEATQGQQLQSWAVDVGSVILNAAVFALIFIVSTPKELTVRSVLPGSVIAAVLFVVLQNLGASYVGSVVAGASNLNSVFALVFGLLVFIYSNAVVLVICMEINVVLAERLWPRSMLTLFTDAVVLTEADHRAYEGQAKAQRLKGFETISADFTRRDRTGGT